MFFVWLGFLISFAWKYFLTCSQHIALNSTCTDEILGLRLDFVGIVYVTASLRHNVETTDGCWGIVVNRTIYDNLSTGTACTNLGCVSISFCFSWVKVPITLNGKVILILRLNFLVYLGLQRQAIAFDILMHVFLGSWLVLDGVIVLRRAGMDSSAVCVAANRVCKLHKFAWVGGSTVVLHLCDVYMVLALYIHLVCGAYHCSSRVVIKVVHIDNLRGFLTLVGHIRLVGWHCVGREGCNSLNRWTDLCILFLVESVVVDLVDLPWFRGLETYICKLQQR